MLNSKTFRFIFSQNLFNDDKPMHHAYESKFSLLDMVTKIGSDRKNPNLNRETFTLSRTNLRFISGSSKTSSWARTNTWRSCIARSKAMWCVTCFVFVAGSIANWPRSTVCQDQPVPTRLVVLAIRTSKVYSVPIINHPLFPDEISSYLGMAKTDSVLLWI